MLCKGKRYDYTRRQNFDAPKLTVSAEIDKTKFDCFPLLYPDTMIEKEKCCFKYNSLLSYNIFKRLSLHRRSTCYLTFRLFVKGLNCNTLDYL